MSAFRLVNDFNDVTFASFVFLYANRDLILQWCVVYAVIMKICFVSISFLFCSSNGDSCMSSVSKIVLFTYWILLDAMRRHFCLDHIFFSSVLPLVHALMFHRLGFFVVFGLYQMYLASIHTVQLSCIIFKRHKTENF